MAKQKFPNLLESIRSAGSTQRERASKFGVTERTVIRWLNEETQPRIDDLVVYPPAITALLEDAASIRQNTVGTDPSKG